MDIQKQMAAAALAKFHQRNGTTPPPSHSAAAPQKKAPIKTGADPKQSSQAKNAAAAAIAARLGGGQPKGPIPSSAAGTGNIDALEKYVKMVKMGVPGGAIRGKMSAEGIPPNVIELVLSGGGGSTDRGSTARRPGPPPPTSSVGGGSSSLSPEEEKNAAPYRRMVNIKMPEGAIRHKMTSDGVPKKIQDSVLAGEVPNGIGGSSSAPSSAGRAPGVGGAGVSKLLPKEEQIATQYRKMMKINMPPAAIRHKMNADGVPQKIQDSVLAGELPGGSSESSSTNRPVPAPMLPGRATGGDGGPVSKLSPKDEQTATQYRKMLKMGLPDGAIIHKMSMDGVPKNVQESVLAREVAGTEVKSPGPDTTGNMLKVPAMSSSSGSGVGSPLATAAAMAAGQRAEGPKRSPRQLPQNPIPQKTENSSGPAALAAAAVASASRRAERQNSNPIEKAEEKVSSQKLKTPPTQMVDLKPRPAPAAPPPDHHPAPAAPPSKPRSTPAPRPRSIPSPSARSGPQPRDPSPAVAISAPQHVPVAVSSAPRESPPSAHTIPKLDPDEEEVADHYRGLVNDGQSLDAIKEEMDSDGAPTHIQEAVLASFAPPPAPTLSSPVLTTPADVDTIALSDLECEEVDDGILQTVPAPSSNRAPVRKASKSEIRPVQVRTQEIFEDYEVNPTPVLKPPTNTPPVTLLDKDPRFKKKSEEPVSELTLTATKKKKKKQRHKTAKGTTVLESGAEQHCACNIM